MAATIALVIALVVFIAGAVAGVLILVSWGIRREERDFTLTARHAPGQLTQGTRRVTGLWVRRPVDPPAWTGQDDPWARQDEPGARREDVLV
jgi:hypothetical protein